MNVVMSPPATEHEPLTTFCYTVYVHVLCHVSDGFTDAALYFYELKSGVRQVCVLFPFLFGNFTDDLVDLVEEVNTGSRTGGSGKSIFFVSRYHHIGIISSGIVTL